MNIFCFIGSMQGKNSTTLKYTKQLIDSLPSRGNNVDVFTAESLNILPCMGCNSCFATGICPQDNKDDMKMIKEKIKKCDLLIIGSPVYIHQISGSTKVFIDRLAHWSHLFPLTGKLAVVCTSTSTSGEEYVTSYLKKVVSAFGCICIDSLVINDLMLEEDINRNIMQLAEKVDKAYKNPKSLRGNVFQNGLYSSMYNQLSKHRQGYEYNYWLKNGLLDFYTFDSFLTYTLNKV